MKKGLLAALLSASVSACATMPIEQLDGVSLAAVEQRVKCEIGQAYLELKERRGYPDLSKWAAGLTLTLAVDSTGSVLPSTSLAGPFGSISPLDISLGITSNAKRTALLNVYVAFIEAARHKCIDHHGLSPLEGHLGLRHWIVRVFEAQYAVDKRAEGLSPGLRAASFNSEKSIGYNLEFVLTLSAGVTPNFIITAGTAKTVLSGEAKSTHSMDIAMVEMADAKFKDIFEDVL